jgi:hypothetical protein
VLSRATPLKPQRHRENIKMEPQRHRENIKMEPQRHRGGTEFTEEVFFGNFTNCIAIQFVNTYNEKI